MEKEPSAKIRLLYSSRLFRYLYFEYCLSISLPIFIHQFLYTNVCTFYSLHVGKACLLILCFKSLSKIQILLKVPNLLSLSLKYVVNKKSKLYFIEIIVGSLFSAEKGQHVENNIL